MSAEDGIIRTGTMSQTGHVWPCGLFYVGNWDGERPRVICSCEPEGDHDA